MALEIERKYFADPQDGGLDADSAPFAVSPNNIINAENIRWGTTDAGVTNVIESIGSTILKSEPQPSITFLTIGVATDTENRRFCYFKFCTTGPWHRIICYSQSTNTEYIVLLSSQVTGGLNFTKDSLIHSTRIANGILYWCEGTSNEPRRININRGLKLNNPTLFVDIEITKTLFTGSILFLTVNTITLTPEQGALNSFSIGDMINISETSNNNGNYTITNVVVSGTTTLTIFPHVNISAFESGIFSLMGDIGITPYVAPLEQSDISWIRRQPGLPLQIEKQTDLLFLNNFTEEDAFMFDYRYISIEYETSTLSSLSALVNYNAPGETFNSVQITVPFEEKITQDVLQIDLGVKFLISGVIFIVKSWNKNVPADLAEIEDHNAGITNLTFIFYNNFTGTALDNAYSVKPFDSLPIYAQTIEFARNRAFMANYVIGYNTPITSSSSLAATPNVQQDGVTVIGAWVKVTYNFGANFHYYLDITNMTSANGFYDVFPQPSSPPPYPGSEVFANLTFIANGPANFYVYLSGHFTGFTGFAYVGATATISSPPFPPVGLTGRRAFKSAANYNLATTFYDNYGRKCGISTPITVNIEDRIFSQIDYTIGINWVLSNAYARNEIPDWAFYYSIDMTKCQRTRFFEQIRGTQASYVTKDADGNYLFTTSAYDSTLLGCAFDITALESASMGYIFDPQLGDIIKIWHTTNVYSLKITAQSGNWVITELQNIGVLNLAGYAFLFEIYTPYKPSASEPYFEIGQLFQVTDPTTMARQYSVIAGTIEGDITLLTRNNGTTDYLTENMSPNDKYYQNWFTDSGRPNFVDTIGQATKQNTIAFSNDLLQGTKSNGLATFDALDTRDIPIECGAIRKLETTSKVQNEIGVVMLSLCEVETVSIYIGEQQLVSSTGNAFITSAPEVIGTINILKGSFGTINPESVSEYRGNVFWFDAYNGRIIQYSVNGLFAISSYKMTRFWKLFANLYLSMTSDQIEALGGRPFIFTAVDPHHNELLISIPKLVDIPPKGYLPDYPSDIFPFDIYDGQGKTIVFKLDTGAGFSPHWQGAYSFNPEYFITLLDSLYSFKYGSNYLHNDETSFNNFYGVQYTSKVMFVSNGHPNVPKVYNSISVESNLIPLFVYFYSSYPIQQSSDLEGIDFKNLEGIWYAPIYRNKLKPTATSYTTDGLLTGEKMRNVAMMIMLEFESDIKQLNLMFVNIGFVVSRGHRV